MANEKRLIDANAFREYWNKNYRHQYANDNFLVAIANFPTVDAVEVPPVKIGDKAYFIIKGQIYEAEICVVQWYAHRYGVVDEIRGDTPGGSVGAPFSEWGKTVFATKEEAEKVLYPCDNCFCGTYRSCEGCSYGERKDND